MVEPQSPATATGRTVSDVRFDPGAVIDLSADLRGSPAARGRGRRRRDPGRDRDRATLYGMAGLGGPEALPIAEFGRRRLRNRDDERVVVTDRSAGYSGAVVDDTALVPGPDARHGHVELADWLTTPAARR